MDDKNNEIINELIEKLDKAFYTTGKIGFRNLKNIIIHPEWFPFLNIEKDDENNITKA